MKYLLLLGLIVSVCFGQTSGWPVKQDLSKNTYRIGDATAHGTGFTVTLKNGKQYILTNWHVCQIAWKGKIEVKSDWYGATVKAKVLKEDPAHDLCAIESVISTDGLKVANKVTLGDSVWSAGYPGLTGKMVHTSGYAGVMVDTQLSYRYPKDLSCPKGFHVRKSAASECDLSITLIDTTMPGAPGASGSPVINSKGQLVGVVNSTSGKNLAMVPLKDVRDFLNSL